MAPELWPQGNGGRVTGDELVTIAVLVGVLGLLASNRFPPAGVVLAGTVTLLVTGVIDTTEAFAGFSNPAPITVAALYVLARAADKTGLLTPVTGKLLGGRTPRVALARLVAPTACASAFLNNTPLVAMLIPDVVRWAQRHKISPSRFLLPLSYAAILGGVVTVLGTSTNLVVSGLLEASGESPLGMFEMAPVGLPVAVIGLAVVVSGAPMLIPVRRPHTARVDAQARERVVAAQGRSGGSIGGPVGNGEPLDDQVPPTSSKAPIVGIVGLTIVVLAAFGVLPIVQGALLGAGVLVATRVLTIGEVREAIDWDVIVLIGAAFGLGAAMEVTGLAQDLASLITSAMAGFGTLGSIAGVVVTTMLLTEVITNNAAAVVVFPIALSVAGSAGIDPRSMAIAVAIAASSSFLTPIGYQTNTMVYGPGGYRFGDYLRLGVPLSLVVVVTVSMLTTAGV